MMPIGWFGVGSGRARRRRRRRHRRANGGVARLRLDLGGGAPGAHRPAGPAVAPAVALGDDGPGARARIRRRGHVAHPARDRHRDPAAAQPGDPGQAAGDGRRAVAGTAARGHRRRVRAGGVRRDRGAVRDSRAGAPTSGSTRCARSGGTTNPGSRASSRRSAASSAGPGRTGPAARRSWPAGCRPRPSGGRWRVATAGTGSSRTSITPGTPWPSSGAWPVRSTGRPNWAGSEITITPLPGPIDADTVRRYEDLGVDRLVLVQDFADMAGGPDAARRGKFLDEMKACAERLDIPERETTWRPTTRWRPRSTPRSPAVIPTASSRSSRPARSSGTTTTARRSTPGRTWPPSACSGSSSTT